MCWQVQGIPPSARYQHGFAAIGSALYVFGGYTGSASGLASPSCRASSSLCAA